MKTLHAISGAGVILLIWVLAADVGETVNPILLPSLLSVLNALWISIWNGEIALNVGMTLYRVLSGLMIGVIVGASLGMLAGSSERFYRMWELPLEFLRALPATALFPFFLIVFGLGDESKIALVALPTALLMLLNTYYGIRFAPPERKRMALVFGANRAQLFFKVTFFEALPQMAIGLRLSLSLALVVGIASEMFIGTDEGVGQRIFDAYLTSSSPVVLSYVCVSGLLGYALNKALIQSEQRLVFWAGK